jgi:hypothetical protein
MKLINNILILFLAIAVFISSNGFILEQYLCFDCETKHKEVAFFEFGEIKHDHAPCGDCADHGHVCDCSRDHEKHEENSDVTYYSIDILYSDNSKAESNQAVFFNYVKDLGIDIFNGFISNIDNNKFITLLKLFKIPPFPLQLDSSIDVCSVLSVFRL